MSKLIQNMPAKSEFAETIEHYNDDELLEIRKRFNSYIKILDTKISKIRQAEEENDATTEEEEEDEEEEDEEEEEEEEEDEEEDEDEEEEDESEETATEEKTSRPKKPADVSDDDWYWVCGDCDKQCILPECCKGCSSWSCKCSHNWCHKHTLKECGRCGTKRPVIHRKKD